MSDNDVENRERIDRLVRKILSNLGKSFDGAKYELSTPNTFYMSELFYVKVKPENDNVGSQSHINVVMKIPSLKEEKRNILKSDEQFHNEMLFYRDYAGNSDSYPRCYYVEENPPLETVIALENVKQRGYEIIDWSLKTSFDYNLAVLKEVGRFHGAGYIMKKRESNKFFNVVNNIQETRYFSTSENFVKTFTNIVAMRPIDYLREHGYDEVFCEKVSTYFSNCFDNVLLRSTKPEEPLAVICHGDVTMNNVMFKNENGQIKVMLIDFAMLRYASPAIDLSTFFSLYCIEEIKNNRIENLLKVYHNSLMEYFEEHNFNEIEEYSYDAFCEDYRKYGLVGYIIATFFLRVVLKISTLNEEMVFSMDIKEAANLIYKDGGEDHTKTLVDMLLGLKEFGCLNDIL